MQVTDFCPYCQRYASHREIVEGTDRYLWCQFCFRVRFSQNSIVMIYVAGPTPPAKLPQSSPRPEL
jgi:hypothetical protein